MATKRDIPVKPTADPSLGVAAKIRFANHHSQQATQAQTWLNEGGAVGDPAARNPLRILVIEDSGMISWLIEETLNAMGHEVCGIARSEDEAVEMAERHRPDLLLVDTHLDPGSGYDAMRRILMNGHIPHIFISGDKISAEHLGPGALALQKPFQDADLEHAIRKAFAVRPAPDVATAPNKSSS
jgi:CheY-like chemotaxis protein